MGKCYKLVNTFIEKTQKEIEKNAGYYNTHPEIWDNNRGRKYRDNIINLSDLLYNLENIRNDLEVYW